MTSEFGFKVTGVDELRVAMERKKIRVQEANIKIIEDSVLVVVRNTKAHFRPRESGDKVISKLSGNPWYRSTPPFQPVPPDPTSRSGSLVAHIGFDVVALGDSAAMGTVGPTVEHGKYVEQGGNGRRPFPYLENGLKDSEAEIGDIVRAAYTEALA